MAQLEIKDLHVSVEDKEILKGLNLSIEKNEIHALMGPNGNGKSTLLAAIMGNPKYQVTSGSITFEGKDVLSMSVDERSCAGIFLGMQYPQEIPGVTNSDFLRAAINARLEKPIPLFKFIKEMESTIKKMEMKPDLAHRFLNEGFSGGEKKRNEIVQMLMLKPSLSMLDEIDSGLDVDALKIVADAIVDLQKQTGMSLLVVSHYARFYSLLKPTHAHVLVDGKIVVSGDAHLVEKIDTEGYDWIEKEYGVHVEEEKVVRKSVSLGSCAAQVKKGA
ncbi:MAG: Fe-S cluster assembly ATPase SufC [Traorella sp.]